MSSPLDLRNIAMKDRPLIFQIPDTEISVEFIDNNTNHYSSLYYESQPTRSVNLASLNAGNSPLLYVGGGGINASFETALSPQNTSLYQTRHLELLRRHSSNSEFVSSRYEDTDPSTFSLLLNNPVGKAGHNDGIVFIDIFSPEKRPYNVPSNVAMVYVAPPLGAEYESDEAFVDAVGKTSRNVARCVARYNQLSTDHDDLPLIESLRLCVFSSGIYNRTPKVDVSYLALVISQELIAELKRENIGKFHIQLPNGTGDFGALLNSLHKQK